MASIGVAFTAHQPHPASATNRAVTMNRFRSESSMRRLIMNDRPRAHGIRQRAQLESSRQYDGGTHRYCRQLDQEDGEENVLRNLAEGERHLGAPRGE